MEILLADDSRTYRRVVQGYLEKLGFTVQIACDGTSAWQILQAEHPPKLAILDWVMPGMDGLDVCRAVRQLKDRPYTYLLLLTAMDRKQDLLEAFQAGVDDYLAKPVDERELRVRLEAGRRILDLQDELIAAREALRRQATHDALTGLWNRGAILDILDRELCRARREGGAVGLILADLDHFKHINDTFGHQAGDAVLKQAAERMAAATRPYDATGRYGGEEFLIVLPSCDLAGTVKIGERLRQRVAAQPVEHQSDRIPVTVSLGAVAFSPPQVADAAALLHLADLALYRAKRNGRNRLEVGGPAGDDQRDRSGPGASDQPDNSDV